MAEKITAITVKEAAVKGALAEEITETTAKEAAVKGASAEEITATIAKEAAAKEALAERTAATAVKEAVPRAEGETAEGAAALSTLRSRQSRRAPASRIKIIIKMTNTINGTEMKICR